MRVTDQYLWNFIFSVFFGVLVVLGIIILETESRIPFASLTITDYALITLATWRLVRLFGYDAITKFFREQFWDAEVKRGSKVVLTKPGGGPRRTLADLMGCPWCLGVWFAALVTFCYLVTPYAIYPIIFLAISSVASFLQIIANLVGHKAELAKRESEG